MEIDAPDSAVAGTEAKFIISGLSSLNPADFVVRATANGAAAKFRVVPTPPDTICVFVRTKRDNTKARVEVGDRLARQSVGVTAYLI